MLDQARNRPWRAPQGSSSFDGGGSCDTFLEARCYHRSIRSNPQALPNLGYHFVSWSDGFTRAARTDIGVDANLNVTANFARNSPRSTTILLKVSANSIVRGRYMTLTSRLSDGVSAGSSVRYEVHRPGMRMNTFERLGTRAVDRTGWSSCRFMATLHGTYQFRVRFLGNSRFKVSASPVRNVFVK